MAKNGLFWHFGVLWRIWPRHWISGTKISKVQPTLGQKEKLTLFLLGSVIGSIGNIIIGRVHTSQRILMLLLFEYRFGKLKRVAREMYFLIPQDELVFKLNLLPPPKYRMIYYSNYNSNSIESHFPPCVLHFWLSALMMENWNRTVSVSVGLDARCKKGEMESE